MTAAAVAAGLGREWVEHRTFDPTSAHEHGVVNGGERLPCAGLLTLVGDDEDPFLLAVCDRCSFEVSVRNEDLDAAVAQPGVEREELWWQR